MDMSAVRIPPPWPIGAITGSKAQAGRRRLSRAALRHTVLSYAAAGTGSGRTTSVLATSKISVAGRSARYACSRIFSGLDAW